MWAQAKTNLDSHLQKYILRVSLCIARRCPKEEANTRCFLHGRREAKQKSTPSLIRRQKCAAPTLPGPLSAWPAEAAVHSPSRGRRPSTQPRSSSVRPPTLSRPSFARPARSPSAHLDKVAVFPTVEAACRGRRSPTCPGR
jgi:hypothetical protein